MTDNDKELKPNPLLVKERKEEILSMTRHFMKTAEEQIGTEPKKLSKEVENYILAYEWPEGEKELETAVKRACILSKGPELEVEDFDLKYRQARSIAKFVESRLKSFIRNINRFEEFNLYDMVIPEVEKSLILMVMRETKGNQVKAARLLGINRNTLRSKIKKLGIQVKS